MQHDMGYRRLKISRLLPAAQEMQTQLKPERIIKSVVRRAGILILYRGIIYLPYLKTTAASTVRVQRPTCVEIWGPTPSPKETNLALD